VLLIIKIIHNDYDVKPDGIEYKNLNGRTIRTSQPLEELVSCYQSKRNKR